MRRRGIATVAGICIAAAVATGIDYWYVQTAPLRDAMLVVKEQLKDPDSAKFREVATFRRGTICGAVNAKNAMGGYAGYREFILFTDGDLRFAPDASDDPYQRRLWQSLFDGNCRN